MSTTMVEQCTKCGMYVDSTHACWVDQASMATTLQLKQQLIESLPTQLLKIRFELNKATESIRVIEQQLHNLLYKLEGGSN